MEYVPNETETPSIITSDGKNNIPKKGEKCIVTVVKKRGEISADCYLFKINKTVSR